jgi:hypothetical protein
VRKALSEPRTTSSSTMATCRLVSGAGDETDPDIANPWEIPRPG